MEKTVSGPQNEEVRCFCLFQAENFERVRASSGRFGQVGASWGKLGRICREQNEANKNIKQVVGLRTAMFPASHLPSFGLLLEIKISASLRNEI